jgi:hypothetical protein
MLGSLSQIKYNQNVKTGHNLKCVTNLMCEYESSFTLCACINNIKQWPFMNEGLVGDGVELL